MTEDEAIYKGNNAEAYQPPTQNPQSAGSNLQQGASGLQTGGGQGDITQQRLPSVNNLKVVIVSDPNSTTTAGLSPVQTATQTWVGPFWGCVILIIIGVIVWAVRSLVKEDGPELPAAPEEAIKDSIANEAPVVSVDSVKKTAKVKKSAAKKAVKKKSKKK